MEIIPSKEHTSSVTRLIKSLFLSTYLRYSTRASVLRLILRGATVAGLVRP